MSEPELPPAPHAAPPATSRRRVAPIVALTVAAVLAGLFWVLASSDSGTVDKAGVVASPQVGHVAPSVRGTTLAGAPFDLSRRKGSWVVLNFFWSQCNPCKAEHPQLVEFVAQQATFADGAELYTIAQEGDSTSDILDFFEQRGGDWPILQDDNGSIFVSFGVSQMPETFIIDPSGVVRLRWAGEIDAITLSQLVQEQRLLYEAGQ
ncbi:MAG: TlpA disulfide reductase family protein [Ilumatobacteraceae bacterium]